VRRYRARRTLLQLSTSILIRCGGGMLTLAMMVILSVRTLCPSGTALRLLGEEFLAFFLVVSFLATVVTGPFPSSLLIRAACGREVCQVLALALALSLAFSLVSASYSFCAIRLVGLSLVCPTHPQHFLYPPYDSAESTASLWTHIRSWFFSQVLSPPFGRIPEQLLL
jgi:hypothetical protein